MVLAAGELWGGRKVLYHLGQDSTRVACFAFISPTDRASSPTSSASMWPQSPSRVLFFGHIATTVALIGREKSMRCSDPSTGNDICLEAHPDADIGELMASRVLHVQ